MLEAELHNKLPSTLQNSEDLLTSSVLGVFEYLSSLFYIQTILEKAVNLQGNPINFLRPLEVVEYHFWPRLESCEPDLLIYLKDEEGHTYLICIEAKYWSPKSSSEDETIAFEGRSNRQRDQLAREIEDIHKDSTHKLLGYSSERIDKIDKRILIYLTNHTSLPTNEIQEGHRHTNQVDFSIDHIYWLPWREFHHFISKIDHYCTSQDGKLLFKLQKLLEKKGLQSFQGFTYDVHSVNTFVKFYETRRNVFSWTTIESVFENHWYYGGI